MTLREKLELAEKQILNGKKALSYALQYVGITAVEPNDNNPNSYEIFQSYADKIKRLQLANNMIFEYSIPTDTVLTDFKRTVVLPMSGISYSSIVQAIVNNDTTYETAAISTLSLDDEDYETVSYSENTIEDSNIISDFYGNEIVNGNYEISINELREYLSEEETMEMASAMEDMGIMLLSDEVSTIADEDVDYLFTVDWGDGTIAEYTSTASTEAIYHTYASGGTYDISINGNFRLIYNYVGSGVIVVNGSNFLDKDGTTITNRNYSGSNYLTKVIAWGNTKLRSLNSAFYYCLNLKSIPMYDTTNSFENVTTCFQAFRNSGIEELPFNSKTNKGLFSNCKNITTFQYCFYDCNSLSGEIPPKLIDGCTNVTSVGRNVCLF